MQTQPQPHVEIWFDQGGTTARAVHRTETQVAGTDTRQHQPYMSLVEWEGMVKRIDDANPVVRRSRKNDEVGGLASAFVSMGLAAVNEDGGAGSKVDFVQEDSPPAVDSSNAQENGASLQTGAAAPDETLAPAAMQQSAGPRGQVPPAPKLSPRRVKRAYAPLKPAEHQGKSVEQVPPSEGRNTFPRRTGAAFGDRGDEAGSIVTVHCHALAEPLSARRRPMSDAGRRRVVDRELASYRGPAGLCASRKIDRPLRKRLNELLNIETPMLDASHLHPSRQHPIVPISNLRVS
mmetsp:Transcript_64089/g.152848  ORF Transcript_64089/g.152848 Transcript_64089/m.152848 type:complete len:291 (-) Transcript_64089:53-925(-)